MTRIQQLAQRRRDLQAQCELQRMQLAHVANHIESQLVTVDRIARIVTLVGHPLAIGALVVGTISIGPWRLMKWVSQGAVVLNVVLRLRKLLSI
jgi:YqjK-like protein